MTQAKGTRKILSDLFELFQPADTFGEDCIRAISSMIADYEDAVMAEMGKRLGMDCIVTRNGKDYRKTSTPVLDPKEFLAMIKNSEK